MNQPLKLTIDISSIIYGRGVSRYTSNLVHALSEHPEIELQLFGSSLRQKTVLQNFAKQFDVPTNFLNLPPSALTKLWCSIKFPPVETFISKTDIFHAWEELIPPSNNIPIVATIHDLAILKFPETAHPSTLYKHSQGWKRLKELGSHVIAVSESTKKDVIELLGFPENKVHVVYEALPHEVEFQPSKDQVEITKQKHNLHKPFLLFVGTQEPRKNLNRLVEAWQMLDKEIDLVVVGSKGWETSSYKLQTINHKLHILGYLEGQELASLYKSAEAFVYPSLYEGFGLTILEAFYHHCPVVTSNISSMPEVAGKAGELVDPLSVESIKNGIEKVLSYTKVEKNKRVELMVKQLEKFSWKKTAEETVKVYKNALGITY